MARRLWAMGLADRCESIDREVREHNERTDIVNRAAGVALENLKSHVGTLESRFQEAQAWARDLLKEQQAALDGWQRAMNTLGTIPARKEFSFLGRPSTPTKDQDTSTGSLRDFVDVEEVHKAGTEAAAASPRFARQVEDIQRSVTGITTDTQRLVQEAVPASVEGADGLLHEVSTVTKKISSDYEHVLALPNNQKTLANISRLALNHTKDLLPSLLDIGSELHAALDDSVNRYNRAMESSLRQMRTISSLESRLAEVQNQIVNLDVQSDAFDTIYSVFHMPMIYGSVLVESVRRREWGDKMKGDSALLAEELAVFRDEEQRRRKKWMKSMGEYLSLPDGVVPSIEVNLQGHEFEWPEVNRKEIELYIEELRGKPGLSTIAQELTQLFKDLDAPTRQQRRRAKAFKQGSIIDMGRSSFLLRGDEMMRSLKDEKTKVEDRLKGSESRIRKLEDLLHRQSHLSRPASGHFGHDFPGSPVSAAAAAAGHPDAVSRRSSISSRRMSTNQALEEKALAQRIVTLETELSAERDTVQRLQREANAERQTNTYQIQEEQSTKKDLIGNLESRQREFEDERRFLEGEAKRFRIRVDELEEELDRTMDGREHERQDADERIQQLEADLQSAQVAADEGDASLRDKVTELETRDAQLQKREQDHYDALQVAFLNLSPGGVAPADAPSIIREIEVLSEGLAIHANRADEDAAQAISNCQELETRLGQKETEAEELRRKADTSAAELAQERSKLQAVTTALDEERARLSDLQSHLAAGETGSDALREQLAEEERKQSELSQRVAGLEAQAKAMSAAEKQAASRTETRGARSQEISRQLFDVVGRFGYMLEQLGFIIIRHNGNIVVQRASKVNNNTTDHLANSEIVSLKPEPGITNWMDAETPEEETDKYMNFVESLCQFDVDVFGDAIVKRVKDIELLARKWQKEARGYRDKYHRTHSDAHDKIAYRAFKDGDLALFLPTRNQAIRSWAAFNIGAPHYFLREQDAHKLQSRDWLLARITKIEERVVDLSKSLNSGHGSNNPDRRSLAGDNASADDENPFELSDGLRWYLVDAVEEKPGAPATPGLAKSTVAAANVDVKGSIRLGRASTTGNVAKTLTRSLDSRRNSVNSRGMASPVANEADTQAQPEGPLGPTDVSGQDAPGEV